MWQMNPILSIIIPTYSGSKDIVAIALKSIAKQDCSKSLFETILADNKGGEPVKKLAKKYGAKLVEVTVGDRQVQTQKNAGIKSAKGKYIMILDHDEEIAPNFVSTLVKEEKDKKNNFDAWHNPFKIIAGNVLLTKVRNFEESFYKDTVVSAARIIKRDLFAKGKMQFDPALNGGPGEWDTEIQLKVLKAKIGYLNAYIYHHEEGLSLKYFLSKKTIYVLGGEIYKRKWQKKNKRFYNEIVKKQYGAFYRLFGIFFERGKWKKVLAKPHLYILYLINKIIIASNYFVTQVQINLFNNKAMHYKAS